MSFESRAVKALTEASEILSLLSVLMQAGPKIDIPADTFYKLRTIETNLRSSYYELSNDLSVLNIGPHPVPDDISIDIVQTTNTIMSLIDQYFQTLASK